jgi:aminocarboxymuconate-semialdehyde decarboxylase
VEVRPWAPEWLREPGQLDAILGRVWFDAHTGGPASRAFLAEAVGADRLLHGTNLAGWDAPQAPLA